MKVLEHKGVVHENEEACLSTQGGYAKKKKKEKKKEECMETCSL